MEYKLVPESGLAPQLSTRFNWRSENNRPVFSLVPVSPLQTLSGWLVLEADLEADHESKISPTLFLNSKKQAIPLSLTSRKKLSTIFKANDPLSDLKLAPCDSICQFKLNRVVIRPLGRLELLQRIGGPLWRSFATKPAQKIMYWSRLSVEIMRIDGWRGYFQFVRERLLRIINSENYQAWIERYDTLSESDRQSILLRIKEHSYHPLISVVMPVYDVDEEWLRKAIESVQRQLYSNWELCIADDCSPRAHVRAVLEEYSHRDSRIKVVFRKANGHISEASNSALSLATGDFIALLDHDDELTEHALSTVVEELNRHPEADLIYSDEDKIDERGVRFAPHFKTDWNPDLFYSLNLITHLGVYRSSIIKIIGGFRKGYEGSQDYDLALRFIEQVPEKNIRHIRHILYHWRAIAGSVALGPDQKNYAHEAARDAIRSHFERKGISAEVVPTFQGQLHRVIYPLPNKAPLVSVILPTRDGLDFLKTCMAGILEQTNYPNLEVIIVNNQSKEAATQVYFEQITRDSRVRVISYDAPFNYAAMNNVGSREAKGEILALLNNDLKMINPGWLQEMVTQALRPEVGMVGAKLYYADNTIQHGGVILGMTGIAGHPYRRFLKSSDGYFGRLLVQQGYSAVTGACMVMRKNVYESLGGMDEKNLPIAFNDIDICLRAREKGMRVVWTPYAQLYHLESATRGSDNTPQRRPSFQHEIAYMMSRWADVIANDPFYSPNLSLKTESFGLAFPPREAKPWQRSKEISPIP